MLRDDAEGLWFKDCLEAFVCLKEMLVSLYVLVHYDPEKEVVHAVDASSYGLGCCYLTCDDREHPIAYASRTLTKAERDNSMVKKEGVAIVFGVQTILPSNSPVPEWPRVHVVCTLATNPRPTFLVQRMGYL